MQQTKNLSELMGTFNGKSLPKFIDPKEVLNENFDETVEETTEEPIEGAAEETVGEEAPVEGAESTEGVEGEPEVIKVYMQENEEDLQELIDAGILGEDETLPEDGFYIKIKTIEGTEETLLFTEKDPEGRIPVDEEAETAAEGEEGTEEVVEDEAVVENFGNDFEDEGDAVEGEEPIEGEEPVEGEAAPTAGRFDTELCAQHGDHEYCIAAEIEISEDGQIEDLDVEEDEETGEPEVQANEVEEDAVEGEEPVEEEEFVTESRKVLNFSDFMRNRK